MFTKKVKEGKLAFLHIFNARYDILNYHSDQSVQFLEFSVDNKVKNMFINWSQLRFYLLRLR